MKKLYLFSVILLLILFSGCNKRQDENILKIMTFNVRYDNPADSFNAWPNRASFVCRFLKNERPDLLGMQEVLARSMNISILFLQITAQLVLAETTEQKRER